jgi:mRNA-degrading endonuclease RelE of RelBE toxin-antitoxin system
VGDPEGPSSGLIARAPREVLLFERAQRDLMDLPAVERAMLATHIDGLALDALPRGAEVLHGRHRDHFRLRVGRFRVLYRVSDGELTIAAITAENSW